MATAAALRFNAGVTGTNSDVVRASYDACARADLDAAMELVTGDVEYVNPESAVEPGVRHGARAFRAALEGVLEGWESWVGEPEQLLEVGDEVVAVVRYTALGRDSALPIEGRESALFSMRDGKVIRYAWFHGPDDAIEAAGARS